MPPGGLGPTPGDRAGRALLGGVEAGGTKVVCAVAAAPAAAAAPPVVLARSVVPTTTPDETLGRVARFFRAQREAGRAVAALGVASFGPLDLDPRSRTYGRITTTPKPGWAGTDLVDALSQSVRVPVALDTDVNGAALAEARWGAGRGRDPLVYLTVGTGVGGGAVLGGRPLRGLLHPEMGHLHVVRHPDDPGLSVCPFHADCVEGLASGPAIRARWRRPADDLGDRHTEAVALEAWYLAQVVSATVYLLSPQRVVLGGGVLGLAGLLDAVREATLSRLAGALDGTALVDDVAGHVVPPGLGPDAGVLGALALAEPLLGEPGRA